MTATLAGILGGAFAVVAFVVVGLVCLAILSIIAKGFEH